VKRLNQLRWRQEILGRLRQIRPETPRLWGKMTAAQMICHLRDSFLGAMGDKPMAIAKGMSPWRLTKPFALYSPFKWPQGVPTRPEFDQISGSGTPPALFDSDMRNLIDVIDRFVEQPRPFEFRPHPLFGRMSERAWMRWGYLHVDHHLRQFGV
jgi:hypothetical protein